MVLGFDFFNENKRLVDAVFGWLSGVVDENDLISVNFGKYSGFYRFEFPLRSGDRPKKISIPQKSEITFTPLEDRDKGAADASALPLTGFIIRKPDKLLPGDEWVLIFSSPEIEVLENKNRTHGIKPLRWGFSDEERKIAFKIARDALQKFLEDTGRLERSYFPALPPRFSLRADVDVALWTAGRLRGSSVIEGRPLGEGIAEAAILSARDLRFKPLSSEDLPDTRIEITVMHDIRIPLSKRERSKSVIYSEKGYLLQQKTSGGHSNILKNVGMIKNGGKSRREGRKGWYLPEVFNIKRFRNLEDFLGDLAQEKAGLSRSLYKKADVFIFEVDDFIESRDRTIALSLCGPIVKQNFGFRISPARQRVRSQAKSGGDFEFRLRAAADWLVRIQESDGNLPPIIDPFTGRATKQIDWPRLAFTAWALAEFGKAIGEEKYIQTAEKSFEYLKRHIISNFQFPIPNFELTLAYFGQLSIALEKTKDTQIAGDKLLERLDTLLFDPIAIAQIASFFKVLSKSDVKFSVPFKNLAITLKKSFEDNLKSGSVVNLAVWAELVNVFFDVDQEFSENIAARLKSRQLPNGAFSESTASNFIYTRGTGKIFEVLALAPEKNREAIADVLQWLFSLQYDEENTFFVPEDIRPKILGGTRHDYLNQELWIDSASHVILGSTRLTKNGFS